MHHLSFSSCHLLLPTRREEINQYLLNLSLAQVFYLKIFWGGKLTVKSALVRCLSLCYTEVMMTQQILMYCDANRFSRDNMRYDRAEQGMDFLCRLLVFHVNICCSCNDC